MTGSPSLPSLTHRLERTVLIEAPRDIVFRFFTDEKRWATWWGAGSTIDATPGAATALSRRTRAASFSSVQIANHSSTIDDALACSSFETTLLNSES